MRSFIAAVAVTLLMGSQSVSACFFPFAPTYSAGYAPWGMGWGGGYQSAAYRGYPSNVGYASYGGGGCNTGSCGTYSAGFQSFASPQLLSYGSGCCNSCGTTCGGTCGNTCGNNVVNYGGCASGCGSSCVGTETRKVPKPDDTYDSDSRRREFGGDRDTRDATDGFRGRDDDLRDDATDGLGAGRGRNDDGLWSPRDSDRREPFGSGDDPDTSRDGFGSSVTPRDRNDFSRPAESDENGFGRATDERLSSPTERGRAADEPLEPFSPARDFEGTGGGAFKPPTDGDPMPEEGTDGVDHTTRKPDLPDIVDEEEAVSVPADDDVNNEDFLPKEETASLRSSHSEILSMQRLAGRPVTRRASATQVSSSRAKQRAPRWISLPMPAGRARL